jgi:hypothetical protein
LEAEVQPDVPQIPIQDFFSTEPMGEMAKTWAEWMAKEKPKDAGTLSQPLQ